MRSSNNDKQWLASLRFYYCRPRKFKNYILRLLEAAHHVSQPSGVEPLKP